MTLFDAIKDGQEFEVEKCIAGKPHDYIEDNVYIKEGKEYQILKCSKCNKVSIGWKYVKQEKSFAKWLDEVDEINQYAHYNPEMWVDYYNEGYTPQEAALKDYSYGSN